ncbi:hypothetical protein EEL50_10315 [Muribaculaceae bacterium Isolate-105 (HZI)]|uniref:hypothetical protein n=1 Tax=Muribaculum intestinale TaxID=1796646 RepID=UPI000F475FC7|nr:hypothetical protein [Muribaculum intestinale]ROT12936.1 hypothetical protein EEL50_10315 [Muribaculaceae bacterium Isolate-105 (HZI)]
MNTASILILCAFVYLAFVTWMFRGKGKKPDTKTGGKKETQETASDSDGEEPKKNVVTVVPQSDFDFDKFREVLTESMAAAMTYVLNARMGDVNPQDVEFKKSEQESCSSAKDDAVNDISDDTPDMDDFEPDSVSPPAKGESIDEIEAAVSVAANPSATPEQKAEAGRVLTGMRDVVFIGKMMETDERINAGIMNCIAESVRAAHKKKIGRPSATRRKGREIDVDGSLRRPDNTDKYSEKDEED